ncbi:hypothetical protein X975_08922, partial [Stegodyphus mimosarum]
KTILHVNKQNETLEGIRLSLLQEVAQFNSAVSSLQISVSRLEENEALFSRKKNFGGRKKKTEI